MKTEKPKANKDSHESQASLELCVMQLTLNLCDLPSRMLVLQVCTTTNSVCTVLWTELRALCKALYHLTYMPSPWRMLTYTPFSGWKVWSL